RARSHLMRWCSSFQRVAAARRIMFCAGTSSNFAPWAATRAAAAANWVPDRTGQRHDPSPSAVTRRSRLHAVSWRTEKGPSAKRLWLMWCRQFPLHRRYHCGTSRDPAVTRSARRSPPARLGYLGRRVDNWRVRRGQAAEDREAGAGRFPLVSESPRGPTLALSLPVRTRIGDELVVLLLRRAAQVVIVGDLARVEHAVEVVGLMLKDARGPSREDF